MAVICRGWSEPALDKLWETLDSFVPLISTLPSDLVHKKAPLSQCQPSDWTDLVVPGVPRVAYTFARHPLASEWATLHKYTSRVRSFSGPYKHPIRRDRRLSSVAVNAIETHVFYILSQSPRPLFPKLQKIVWYHATVENIYILRLLAGPMVNLLHLPSFTQMIPPRNPVPIRHDLLECEDFRKAPTVISSLGALFPSLRSFRMMHYTFHDTEVTSAMWDAIRRWEHLSTLSCRILDSSSLKHLERLSSLQQLTLHLLDQSFSSSSPGFRISLPHLQDVRLVGAYPEITGMVDALGTHMSLRMFQSEVEHGDGIPTTANSVPSLLNLLSRHCDNNTLDSLMMREHPTLTDHSYTITFSTLQPALSFRQLTVISIDTYRNVSLTDVELVSLASAWPKARTLRINPGVGWILPSKVTLRALAAVLELLPVLEHLALAIDARILPSSSEEDKLIVVHHPFLKTLNLTDSRVGQNHDEVAQCFSQFIMLPDDCILRVSLPHESHNDWTRIFDLLRRFREDPGSTSSRWGDFLMRHVTSKHASAS